MENKNSKRLVIDACIARSAGETEHPKSKACRDFLTDVLKICHRIVMSEAIKVEWDKHQSRFAAKWRGAMKSRKKLISLQQSQVNNSELVNIISDSACSPNQKEAMLKDVHLIEAALATDHIVVSLDEAARKLFDKENLLEQVSWVNPTIKDETLPLTANRKEF